MKTKGPIYDAIRAAFGEGFHTMNVTPAVAWERSEARRQAEYLLEPDAAPTERHQPLDCRHEGFSANVAVQRLEDVGKFIAEVTVRCVQCDEAFRFLGVPAGLAFDKPTVNIDETVLNAPIEPEGLPRLQMSASFQVPTVPVKH